MGKFRLKLRRSLFALTLFAGVALSFQNCSAPGASGGFGGARNNGGSYSGANTPTLALCRMSAPDKDDSGFMVAITLAGPLDFTATITPSSSGEPEKLTVSLVQQVDADIYTGPGFTLSVPKNPNDVGQLVLDGITYAVSCGP